METSCRYAVFGFMDFFFNHELSSQAALSDTAAVKGYDSIWLHGHDNVAAIAYQISQKSRTLIVDRTFLVKLWRLNIIVFIVPTVFTLLLWLSLPSGSE